MPDPAVVVAMREFKAGLLAREDNQMHEMANQWVQVEDHLAGLVELTAQDFAQRRQDGETISAAALYRLERYKRLRGQARDEFGQYAQWADGSLTTYQQGSVDLGLEHSAQSIQLSYWPGVGAYFDRLPREAVQNLVGIAGNGRPLGELLKNRMVTQDADVWQRLVNNLVRGTALGKNPRDVARQMRDDLAGGLNKALVIARTEGLRPYRETSRAQYEASGVVTGQKRLSAHDGRVCGACLADDGTVYGLDEVISDHPNGRCTSVPIVRGMPETTWLSGEDWFRQQDEDTQLSILGKGKLEAYRDGRFEFKDLVRRTDDPTWGKGLNPRSLDDLLSGGRDRGAPAVDLRTPKVIGRQARQRLTEIPQETETEIARLTGELDLAIEEIREKSKRVNDLIRQAKHAKTDAEKDRIWKEIGSSENNLNPLYDKRAKLMKQRSSLILEQKTRAREVLYVDNPSSVGFKWESRFKGKRKAGIERGFDEFRKLVERRILDEKTVGVYAGGGGRPHASQGNIWLSTRSRESDTIHELGHVLEYHDPEVHQKALDFLTRRTAGEKNQWLGDNYNKHEKGKRDKFVNEYMGKDYGGRATEIISMGLEEMWRDPAKFAKDDPGYFDFIFDLMRGQ